MGILRADRITGLGGANAIKGSTKFSDNRLLEIHGAESNEDFRLSNGSFTIEFWAYVSDTSNSTFVGLFENNPARRSWQFEARSSQALRFEWWTDGSSGSNLTASTGSFIRDRWQHFAVVRNGTALNIYVDGTSVANTTTSDTFYENTIEPLTIGGIFQSGGLTQEITGFISNLRIIKGEAIYTANFTPPTSELTVTSNTVVLACQSPGNVFKEATGKTVVARTTSTNDAPPQASHFRPNSPVGFSTTADVGSQYGSTFNGFGNFATSTYMVPPGGNTPERNRGRGIFHGGYVGPSPGNSYNAQLAAVNIQNTGSFYIFGDLTQARYTTTTVGSSTRSIFAGGAIATPSPFASVNTMDFVTIANSSNATDFGDTTSTGFAKSAVSSGTRGVITGGRPYTPSAGNALNTLDLVTIATTGNATDFGDLTAGGRFTMPNTAMSPTRGLFAGGKFNSPSDYVNNIESITIATTGDTTDFGDLLVKGGRSSGNCSSNTRGVFSLSNYPSSDSITLEFVTIASTGNATDFGDHATATTTKGALSDTISGLFYGGFSPAITGTYQNTVDQITIATTGNAVDWGDIQLSTGSGRGAYASGISDSHGGLS